MTKYFIGSARCFETYAHHHGYTRSDEKKRMGRDLVYVTKYNKRGRYPKSEEDIITCTHCFEVSDEYDEVLEALYRSLALQGIKLDNGHADRGYS